MFYLYGISRDDAEDITSRFVNVVTLLHGLLPLAAIQMRAIRVGEHILLVFRTVLDEMPLGLVEEDEEVQDIVHCACREQRGAKESVSMAEADKLPGLADRCSTIKHDKPDNLISAAEPWAKNGGTALRILAIADIHGAIGVYEWLREAAAEYRADLLILAGDLLIGGWEDEQSEQARTLVLPLLRMVPVPVCYIMGNDDHVDLASESESIKPVHGRRIDSGPCSVVGYQYSPPFVGGCFEKQEEEIAIDLGQIEPLLDETTVLVTHTPAYGYADRIFSGNHVGSHALAESLARKSTLCHIHGHIHHSFGRAGNHFNVAAGGRRRAMIIDIPSLSHRIIEEL